MKILFNGDGEIEVDDEFSFQNFVCQSVDIPDNTTVYMSCFAQETKVWSEPDENGEITLISDAPVECFRPDMTGVIFRNCNMTGCVIPLGNTVINI